MTIATPTIPKLNNLTLSLPTISGNAGLTGNVNAAQPASIGPIKPLVTGPTSNLLSGASIGGSQVVNSGLNQNGSSIRSTIPTPAMPITTPASPVVPPPVQNNHVTSTNGNVYNGSTGGQAQPAIPTQPAYDTMTGLLTDYGRSQGLPEVNGQAPLPAAPIAPPAPPAPTDPLSSPLYTSPEYEAALNAYKSSLAPTADQVQNTTDINNIESGLRQASTNAEGQAIPLDFITGQQKRLQDTATNLETPLVANGNLLQAKQQAAIDASKAALDSASTKLEAYRDINKPVTLGYGGSIVNPSTGAVTVPAFGGTGGSSGGAGINPTTGLQPTASTADILGYLAANGVDATRYNIQGLLSAVQNGATADDIINGRGAAAGVKAAAVTSANASPAADAASLKTQQSYADTTQRSYSTATANLDVLNKFMTQYGINQSNVPVINQLNNKIKAGLTDPGAVAAFNTTLQGLRAEYAQVLSRGGEVTDSSRASANSLIPDDLSPAQLAIVTSQLKQEGANAIAEANQSVTDIQNRINGTGSSTNLGTNSGSSVGTSWDNL